MTRLDSGEAVVRLRRVPALPEDALLVAHELTHVIQESQGFPLVGGAGDLADLASAINSMLHDPLLHPTLRNYNFDLAADAESELRETVRQVSNVRAAPDSHLDKTHWLFNYVGHILEWESASAGSCVETLRSLFRERFPDIAVEGERLVSSIREKGFDTPEKMLAVFEFVIARYELGAHVVIQRRAPTRRPGGG